MSNDKDTTALLEFDSYYHIFNRGNNRENIFYSSENYRYFLKKYDHYLSDYLNTYCFCLLPNHFHFLVRIKSQERIAQQVERDFKNVGKYAEMQVGQWVSERLLIDTPSKLIKEDVLAWFRGKKNYVVFHQQNVVDTTIEPWSLE